MERRLKSFSLLFPVISVCGRSHRQRRHCQDEPPRKEAIKSLALWRSRCSTGRPTPARSGKMKSRHRSSDIPESEASLPKQQAGGCLVTEAQIGKRHRYIMDFLGVFCCFFCFPDLRAEKNSVCSCEAALAESDGSTVTVKRYSKLLHLPALIPVLESFSAHV